MCSPKIAVNKLSPKTFISLLLSMVKPSHSKIRVESLPKLANSVFCWLHTIPMSFSLSKCFQIITWSVCLSSPLFSPTLSHMHHPHGLSLYRVLQSPVIDWLKRKGPSTLQYYTVFFFLTFIFGIHRKKNYLSRLNLRYWLCTFWKNHKEDDM